MRTTGWLVLSMALLLAGPVGCGKKEVDELRTKVTALEKDIADTKARLADKERETDALRAENDAKVQDLTQQLNKAKVERDKLKQELNALKKKKK